MSKQLAKVFDYSSMDTDTRGKLIWYAGEILRLGQSHVETGMEMGKLMAEARDLCDSGKTFQTWVESECGHSVRSAYNYMAAYESFGSCANFARIELSAMYELTKNEGAKKQALRLAGKGVSVTYSMAKTLLEKQGTSGKAATGDSAGEDGRTDSDGTEANGDDASHGEDATDTAGETDAEAVGGGETSAASVVLDAINRPVPERFRDSHELAAAIQTEARKLDSILRALRGLRDEPGGHFLHIAKLETAIKDLKGDIYGACYWSECPKCEGGNGKPCAACEGIGWWPHRKKGHLSAADKEWLGCN